MCCLFGAYNYSGKAVKSFSKITNLLAEQATVRGMDATGIAFCNQNKLVIHKEPKSAYEMNFKHPDDIVAVMGHTRHATQGSNKDNYNNHPFSGSCKNVSFALAHNGVLSNDKLLQKEYRMPKTKIETDSYIAVQLLKYKKILNADSIKFMAENVQGSFAFSVLDSENSLWLIKGDSPLSLVHFPKRKMYVYASTEEIMYKAIVDTTLFEDVKKGDFVEIQIKPGDILNIRTDGTIVSDKFNYTSYSYGRYNWWSYNFINDDVDDMYVEDIKSIAKYYGYAPETIDELIAGGFTLEEIEEYIYCME